VNSISNILANQSTIAPQERLTSVEVIVHAWSEATNAATLLTSAILRYVAIMLKMVLVVPVLLPVVFRIFQTGIDKRWSASPAT